MKRLFLFSTLCFLLVFTVSTFAQSINIKGGLNLANMQVEIEEQDVSFDNLIGFHIGASAEVALNDFLAFEPGLMVTTKGFTQETTFFGVNEDLTLRTTYIDIPLLVKARYEFNDGLSMYGAVGPYVGFGISGKTTLEETDQGQTIKEEDDIEWGTDENEDDLKPMDVGLSFGAGLEINSIIVGIGYELGMSNVLPFDDDGQTLKNRVFRVTVGYMLNR